MHLTQDLAWNRAWTLGPNPDVRARASKLQSGAWLAVMTASLLGAAVVAHAANLAH